MTLSMNIVAAAVHAVKYGSWYTNADGTQRLRDQVVVAVAVGGGAAEARSAIARTRREDGDSRRVTAPRRPWRARRRGMDQLVPRISVGVIARQSGSGA